MAVERDDLTVGLQAPAEIDVVLAPLPMPVRRSTGSEADTTSAPEPSGQVFDGPLQGILGDQLSFISVDPARQRYAWRTTITPTSERVGARSRTSVLGYDTGAEQWQPTRVPLPRDVRDLVYAELVDTRRNLDIELRRPGTAIRRILNDLQVANPQRGTLEQQLASLGDDILQHSGTLLMLRDSLNELDRYVDALGVARIDPVPRTLEELARTVGVSFADGADLLASRLHGSGVLSLASLLAQDVFYRQTLGVDGGDIRPHPVTLIEEPETHLHPHAVVEVAALLESGARQVVATTHSPLLATTVTPESLLLLRRDSAGSHCAVDIGPAEHDGSDRRRTKQPRFYASEMEKLTRLVERPFGELLFARAVVVGDGATERAFLPVVLREALGPLAHGISVIDSGGMNEPAVQALTKFVRHAEIPLVIVADADAAGREAVQRLLDADLLDENSELVWMSPNDTTDMDTDSEGGGAIEKMMIAAAPEACMAACASLGTAVERANDLLATMKHLKGSVGRVLAMEFVQRYPYGDGTGWPEPLRRLTNLLRASLNSEAGDDEGST